MPNATNNFRISTPHACVKIWNFNDRITNGTPNANFSGSVSEISQINETILNTVSCMSIHTSKAKGSPAGSFELVLAPTSDWLSRITSGSWCAIMMSTNPITATQLKFADANYVKMIGKIESVRLDVSVNEEGARMSRYIVTGTDWGHIFNNILYIDNLIAGPNDPQSLGNVAALNLQRQIFGDGNAPQSFKVVDNLAALLGIFGTSSPLYETGKAINRLQQSMYDFIIPTEMAQFCRFIDADGNANTNTTKLSNVIGIQSGKLVAYDSYQESNDAYGFIDPFSVQGTNTFWQLLQDNNNPALNELYNEIDWEYDSTGKILGPSLTIFSRIKPFSYNPNVPAINIRSPFTLLKLHRIDSVSVTNISIATNWRDKYNFVEVRPQFSDFQILGSWTAQKAQGFDSIAFNREGFRPLILGTKQFPVNPSTTSGTATFNADILTDWITLLKEWYFNTHRLLNGIMTIKNQQEYIGVGNNIMFDAGLVNPTANINSAATSNSKKGLTNYILAHVENVEHTFTVDDFGTRTYNTTVEFVRGILVNDNGVNSPPTVFGDGSLDQLANAQTEAGYKNINTVGFSDPSDPDPQKLKGT
jgi:hypothetical protein